MSYDLYDCDGTTTIYNHSTPVARKEHKCCACGEAIKPGTVYVREFMVFDGEACTFKRCARCEAIHKHLREKAPGEMYPDNALACGNDYEEEWGEEPPPEIAALAFALPGELQVLEA